MLAVLAAALLAQPALAAPGDLDTSWDGDGIRSSEPGRANDVAVQPDGKVLVVTAIDNQFNQVLIRYNADGSLDTSFDGDGFTTVNGEPRAIAVQSDGKVLVAGVDFNGDFFVARYNANGAPDTSFDGDGEASADFGAGFAVANDVVIQSGGRILLAGTADMGASGEDFALARFTSSGAPDTSFDTDGRQTTDFGTNFDRGEAVGVQSSGRIVVVGSSSGDFALAGYTDAGALDSGFGASGLRTTDFGAFEEATGMAILSDGRIVAAGHSGSDNFALARYDVNGTLDPSCDNDGMLTTAFTQSFQQARDVAVQFNDRFVVVGVDGNVFALARYQPADCALDTGFGGGDGKVTTTTPGAGNGAYAVAIHAETGKIVALGDNAGEPGNLIVARYLGDEPPPPQQPPPEQPPPEQPPPQQPPPDPCANDRTGPALTIRSLQDQTLYRQRESPASVRIEASDPSGLASDPSDPSRDISTRTVGLQTVTVTARDRCNNETTRTFRYRVAGDPAIGIAGVRAACTTSSFLMRVTIESDVSLRSLVVRLDGRVIAQGNGRRLTVKIPTKRLSEGRHVLTVTARDRAGNRVTERANFARCVTVTPHFTG